jgi:hypothetical protein
VPIGTVGGAIVKHSETFTAQANSSSTATATGSGASATANAEAVATVDVNVAPLGASDRQSRGASGGDNGSSNGGDGAEIFVPATASAEVGSDSNDSASLW